MRADPVAYTWGRPTPKLRKAPENPLRACLRGHLLPRRALPELYAPRSLGDCLQFIQVQLTFWGRRWVANRLTKLDQELLQRPCRCIDKQELALLFSYVSEGVHHRPWNVDNRACISIDLALAKDELELAFEDVVGFILGAVQVRRCPALGRDLVLEDPHALALVPINLEGQKLVSKPHRLSLTLSNVDRFLGPCLLFLWLHAICSFLRASSKEGPSES